MSESQIKAAAKKVTERKSRILLRRFKLDTVEGTAYSSVDQAARGWQNGGFEWIDQLGEGKDKRIFFLGEDEVIVFERREL